MLTVAAARERIDREVGPLDAEPVPLSAAGGRVLASDVVASGDYPSFETTAMDGYAVAGPGPERSPPEPRRCRPSSPEKASA